MCMVTLHNIQYKEDGNESEMVQFDYYVSPVNTCSVSEVYVKFGSEYVVYTTADVIGLDSDCGLRSDDCKGISHVMFCQGDTPTPDTVDNPSISLSSSPSGIDMFDENSIPTVPSINISNVPTLGSNTPAPSVDSANATPTAMSLSLAPSQCYMNNCGASSSNRSEIVSGSTPICSGGLKIEGSMLPVYDMVSKYHIYC